MNKLTIAIRLTCILIALLGTLFICSSAALACPGCKEALASEGQGNIVQGYFWSILFMMAMPFALVGAFSGYMYLEVRRARGRQAAEQNDSTTAGGD